MHSETDLCFDGSLGIDEALRASGIDSVGELPWGAHFCQFYRTADELTDILVPYFAAGIAGRELCLWVVSPSFGVEAAKAALRRAAPDLDAHLAMGRIDILPFEQFLMHEGALDADHALQIVQSRLDHASACGFEGMRIAGNMIDLGEADWPQIASYETRLGTLVASSRLLALCAHPLPQCGAAEVLDILARHDFALMWRTGRWEAIKTLAARGAGEAPQDSGHLRTIVEGAVDGIMTVDEAGVILSVNAAVSRMFGYQAHEAVGRRIDALVAGEEESIVAPALWMKEAGASGLEHSGRRKDGSVFPLELSFSEARFDGERLFIGFLRDLGERRGSEAQMRILRADRLDLMAQMAAGVAHEINQPLSAISTYIGTARRLLRRRAESAGLASDVDGILDSAVAQVTRAAQIIGHLRGFVNSAEPDKTLQSLHDIVHDACDFTDHDRSNVKVTVTLDLAAPNDRVIVDRTQIRQVIVNLKRNAIEAMQSAQRRQLVISTHIVDGGMIRVDIADTGGGMSTDLANLLFEPFVTTKTHGIGVGLAVSRSIVEAHYGRLWADANPGGGAIMSFTLPLAGEHGEARLGDA